MFVELLPLCFDGEELSFLYQDYQAFLVTDARFPSYRCAWPVTPQNATVRREKKFFEPSCGQWLDFLSRTCVWPSDWLTFLRTRTIGRI